MIAELVASVLVAASMLVIIKLPWGGTAPLAARRHVALLRHAYRSAQIGLGTQVHASAAPRRSMWTWVTVTNPMSKSGEFGEKAAPAATVRPSPPP